MVEGILFPSPQFFNMKQIYMLTNGVAEIPNVGTVYLYAGLGYELNKDDAIALIESGSALPLEDIDEPSQKIKRSRRIPSVTRRSKIILQG